jgi:hypothetical protein
MSFQTVQNDDNNRGQESKKALESALTAIWLRGLDSNQRPSGYTYPIFSYWRGLSHHPNERMQGANEGLLLGSPSSL